MSYTKLGMAAFGAAAAYGMSRGRGRRGTRYNADEWLEFFSGPGEPTAEAKRLRPIFTDRIEFLLDEKFDLPDEAPYPDLDEVAYLSYATVVGHGIGLWEDREPWHSAFEKVVHGDQKASDLAYKLDDEFSLASAEGEANRGRRAMQGRRAPTVKWEWDGDWRTTILRTRVYAKQLLDAGRLKDTPELRRAWTDHRKLIKLVEKGERGSAARGRRAKTKKPKSIFVQGRRWRDSYGNTYHTADIIVDGYTVYTTPITYGYGDHYVATTATEWLVEQGYLRRHGRSRPAWILADEEGIDFDYAAENVRRKKDL